MTDYEMISAVQGYQSNGMTVMLNFFTFLAAYLVAGYLAAHRLSLIMTLFVTALFVAASLNGVLLMYFIGQSLQTLLVHMHETAVAGKGLLWTRLAKGPVPDIWVAGSVALIVMFGAVVGSVYFFFECRSLNRKAAAGAALAST